MNTLALMTVAVAASVGPQYRFDLDKIFVSPTVEASLRESLLTREQAFAQAPPDSIANAQALATWLATYDTLDRDLQRHEIYVYLRSERDRDDHAAAEADVALSAAIDDLEVSAERTLANLRAQTLDEWLKTDNALARQRYFIETKIRDASRRVDAKTQALLVQPALDSLSNSYVALRRQISKANSAGAPDTEPSAAFRAKWKPYLDNEAAFAALLEPLVAVRTGEGRLQGFASAPEAAYARAGLTAKHVQRLLAAVRKSDSYRRYVEVLASAAAKRLRVARDALHAWDLDEADGYKPAPVAFPDAVKQILGAEHALGAEYATQFDRLFDPAHGRVELCSGEKCDDAGFSVGFAGTDSGLFYGAYAGSTDNMRAVAHESGHAVHRQFMKENQPIAAYQAGPHFLFESFAIFNELVFLDHLYRSAPSAPTKAYYLHQFLDRAIFNVFGSARETGLEESIYAGFRPGTVRDASDFDALTVKTFSEYTPPSALADEQKAFWARNRLYFTDPLYDVNYLYAGLLALNYLQHFEHDPRVFSRRYVALLKNGFTAPPQTLLREFLDIDVDDADALVSNASERIDYGSRQLDALYAESGTQKQFNGAASKSPE